MILQIVKCIIVNQTTCWDRDNCVLFYMGVIYYLISILKKCFTMQSDIDKQIMTRFVWFLCFDFSVICYLLILNSWHLNRHKIKRQNKYEFAENLGPNSERFPQFSTFMTTVMPMIKWRSDRLVLFMCMVYDRIMSWSSFSYAFFIF